uniref:Uncharacterized protein n=1 Tax=Oryza sativa subsp. japonica TaxID=39947 RepID=Q6ETL1_ORYSJ|nr:hypothetical protein [Oryza sativa Japonica Group]
MDWVGGLVWPPRAAAGGGGWVPLLRRRRSSACGGDGAAEVCMVIGVCSIQSPLYGDEGWFSQLHPLFFSPACFLNVHSYFRKVV